MKPLRVGILANTYLHDAGLRAGGHVNFVEIARRLHDVEITVFAPPDAETEVRRVLPDAAFVAMPGVRGSRGRVGQLMRAILWVSVRAKLREMDVLWATSHFLADVIPAIGSKPERVAVTIHHYVGSSLLKQGSIAGAIIPLLSQFVAFVISRPFVRSYIFVSPFVRRQLAWLVGNKRTFMSSNGVVSPALRTNVGGKADLVVVSRLYPSKRIEDAIEAWSRISPDLRSGKLHIVGDGLPKYRDALVKLAAGRGVAAQVVFHGHVSESEKWAILENSAVFIFPSAEEGWGIAVAEAMAAGLPCVTADLPVYVGLFDCGRISVPVGDVASYARACEKLLSDEKLREDLAEEATQLAATLTWERAAKVVSDALYYAANTSPARTQ